MVFPAARRVISVLAPSLPTKLLGMRVLSFVLLALVALACSSTSNQPAPAGDGGVDGGDLDAASPDSADAAPPPHYPAFTPAMAQIVDHKGGVIKSPKIVTVTWSIDPNEAYYQSFGDTITASDFWKTAVSEYGVGQGTSGGHVSIKTPPPSTMQDSDLDAYIATQVTNAPASGWPINDSDTIYMLMLPEQLKLTLGGNTECNSGVGGYHTETISNGNPVVYAIVGLECHTVYGEGVTQFATQVGSHELGEAATDPYPGSMPGYYGYDDAHWAFAPFLSYQYENGDACEFFGDSVASFTKPPFVLQRLWSNLSARTGHNPCVPNTDPYFSVTPLDMVDITIHDQSPASPNRKIVTKGYAMKVGQAASVDFGFYSDGPVPKWTVEAVEGSPVAFSQPSSPTLTMALQGKSGVDGDIGSVYITPNYPSPPQGTLVTLVSHGATAKHYMPFLIMATK